ncbi:lactase/phlorizin hydrolase-like [Adelges cooleyi]|uniref:lactase/phlorizin hydrolase-like n=1 Tax=Adelges cooleyi TaxID=133065 RepID=UPI00218070A2|nr:lactase/phlorizin hydrolase-like [Adelges cooleyi]
MATIEFPDVLFGTSTSAYQIEGAYNEDGKTFSILDTAYHGKQTSNGAAGRSNGYLKTAAAYVPKTKVNQANSCPVPKNNDNGDIACDSYHKIEEDVSNLKDLGVQVYRFSISWTRIFPGGSDKANPLGINYYKKLIEQLKAEKITPMVTLYHWDLPQELQDIGGWANEEIIENFLVYCRLVFGTFGDDVKYWITLNEPRMVANGYGGCSLPPKLGDQCSGIEDYKAMRNLLLAHAKAYRLYEKEFKEKQQGEVTLCIDAAWVFPFEKNSDDKYAAELCLQSTVGVFIQPLITGQFPQIVLDSIEKTNRETNRKTKRLIQFNEDEKKLLTGSYDYIGFNYYFSWRVSALSENDITPETPLKTIDQGYITKKTLPTDIVEGFTKLVDWMNEQFKVSSKSGSHKFFICENGTPTNNYEDKVNYHQGIFEEMYKAIKNNINIFGYCVWSFMDSFEWGSGYEPKYGIYEVDFNDEKRTRTKKPFFGYFKKLFQTKKLTIKGKI